MKGDNIRIVITGFLVAVFLVCGTPQVLHADHAWISVVHHFFHANIFHLAVNCLSIWTLYRKGYRYAMWPILCAFTIASISWFFSTQDVVGFSNFLFATIGLRTPSIRHTYWRDPSVILFLTLTILMAFLPNVSAVTHIVSFVLGCIVAGAYRLLTSIRRDFGRATYNR